MFKWNSYSQLRIVNAFLIIFNTKKSPCWAKRQLTKCPIAYEFNKKIISANISSKLIDLDYKEISMDYMDFGRTTVRKKQAIYLHIVKISSKFTKTQKARIWIVLICYYTSVQPAHTHVPTVACVPQWVDTLLDVYGESFDIWVTIISQKAIGITKSSAMCWISEKKLRGGGVNWIILLLKL